jgi:hypothetical protein
MTCGAAGTVATEQVADRVGNASLADELRGLAKRKGTASLPPAWLDPTLWAEGRAAA